MKEFLRNFCWKFFFSIYSKTKQWIKRVSQNSLQIKTMSWAPQTKLTPNQNNEWSASVKTHSKSKQWVERVIQNSLQIKIVNEARQSKTHSKSKLTLNQNCELSALVNMCSISKQLTASVKTHSKSKLWTLRVSQKSLQIKIMSWARQPKLTPNQNNDCCASVNICSNSK